MADFNWKKHNTIEQRSHRMMGDMGYLIGCLISIGMIFYIVYRIFITEDFLDRIFNNWLPYALFIGVPWALGWGFRCLVSPYLGIRLLRRGAWENDWKYVLNFVWEIVWKDDEGHPEQLSGRKKRSAGKKQQPGHRYLDYVAGLERRAYLFLIGAVIIGSVLAFEDFVMWHDNVIGLVMIALFWALGISIVCSIIDIAVLFPLLFRFMDNRAIGRTSKTALVVVTLSYVYFPVRNLFF